jgi:fructokinase
VSAVAEQGIGTEGIVYDKKVPTTLALVHKLPDGDRDFSFYRDPGADIMLTPEEVRSELIKRSRLFHFGSLSLTDAPARYATQKAVLEAKHAGKLISFDPNLREPLWSSLDEAKEQIAWGMSQCDVLKISDNEIRWFTGIDDFDEAAGSIREKYRNIRLMCLTEGPDGSAAYYNGRKAEAGAFEMDDTIETTGAGDTFCGCMLSFVLDHGLEDLSEKDLADMLTFANAAAAIVTTRKGALRMMPYRNEIEELIAERM